MRILGRRHWVRSFGLDLVRCLFAGCLLVASSEWTEMQGGGRGDCIWSQCQAEGEGVSLAVLMGGMRLGKVVQTVGTLFQQIVE